VKRSFCKTNGTIQLADGYTVTVEAIYVAARKLRLSGFKGGGRFTAQIDFAKSTRYTLRDDIYIEFEEMRESKTGPRVDFTAYSPGHITIQTEPGPPYEPAHPRAGDAKDGELTMDGQELDAQ